MEIQPKLHALGLIKWLLALFRIGYFFIAFGLIVWAIYSIFIFFTDSPTVHMQFPVMFSISNNGLMNIPNHADEFIFSMQGLGVIGSESIPKNFLALYSLMVLAASVCMLLYLRQIIAILDSVKTGSFFVLENAIRLRWIAILGIIILFFDRLATISSASFFSDKLEVSGLKFVSWNKFTFMELDSLFASLFLLVIAEAFRVGAQLKQENDLTI